MINKDYYYLIKNNKAWAIITRIFLALLFLGGIDLIKISCSNVEIYDMLGLIEIIGTGVLMGAAIIYALWKDNSLNDLMNNGTVVEANIVQENSRYIVFDLVKIQAVYTNEYGEKVEVNTVSSLGANIYVDKLIHDAWRIEDKTKVNILVNKSNPKKNFVLLREQFNSSNWPSVITFTIIVLAFICGIHLRRI